MGFRTIVITNSCKCSYQNDRLMIRGEKLINVHLSEVDTIIFDTTAVSVTSYLMCELMKWKINLIVCDECHNPIGELLPLYANYHAPKNIFKQIMWNEDRRKAAWTKIIHQKILNQSKLLKVYGRKESIKLDQYLEELEYGDNSNREGHAAKVYFNSLFGKEFSRKEDNDLNASLNYGYSLILSTVNKEIVSNGYLTQIGIFHKNEYNMFNLSCDIMEPIRIMVDKIVIDNMPIIFDGEMRKKLINIFNIKVKIDGCEYYFSSALAIYVQSVLKYLNSDKCDDITFMEIL